MPFVMYDADIAGDGTDALISGHIYIAACFIDTPGAGTRPLEVGSDGHVLRAGWISFGASLAIIGGVTRSYWRQVWWLDFLASMWTPDPSNDLGLGTLSLAADQVQWHLPPGGHAHLWVYGN